MLTSLLVYAQTLGGICGKDYPVSEPSSLARDPQFAKEEPAEPHALGCPFCERRDLELTLATTDHFYLLADHAPLIEGHLLIVPHGHYACYGAVPAAFESEFAALKQRAARFLAAAYRAPTFFEHGVYRQTVFHAHLHALPFGVKSLNLLTQAELVGGRPARSLADVRAWYTERGHYFSLEEATDRVTNEAAAPPMATSVAGNQAIFGEAAIFPPETSAYSQALGMLWQSGSDLLGGWRTPHDRFAQRGPMLARLGEAWRAFVANGG